MAGSRKKYVIGIDFDNTIINYDSVIYNIAYEMGLVDAGVKKDKKEIRDNIRKLENGDVEWQKIQALIYGDRIKEAEMFSGVKDFFRLCVENNLRKYVVSHKTQYSNLYKDGVDFRDSALNWMRENNFFCGEFEISEKDVFFESTREEKLRRIKDLGCTHFIDDLVEVFLDEEFPEGVHKILFDKNNSYKNENLENMIILNGWNKITDYIFNDRK